VFELQWLNYGLGVANVVTWTLSCFLLNGYLFWKSRQFELASRTALLWSSFSSSGGMSGMREFLVVGVPATLWSCSEWWWWEIQCLIVGLISSVDLAANVAMMTAVNLLFMISNGIMNTASSLVGNAIGCGDIAMAKTYAAVSCSLGAAISALILLPALFIFDNQICAALTDEADVKISLKPIMHIYALILIPDHCANILSGS